MSRAETLCEVCGARPARYVCRNCGARVCRYCIDLSTWMCVRCSEKFGPGFLPEVGDFMASGAVKLLIIGVVLTFVGFILMAVASLLVGGGAGGVVLIGPFPIIFGSGGALPALLLVLVLVVFVAMFLLPFLLTWLRGE